MTPKPMSPLDSWFLHGEDATSHMHIASVGIFEDPQRDWVHGLVDRSEAPIEESGWAW